MLPRSFNSSPDWTYYDENFKNAFVSLEHRLDNGWRGKLEYNYRQFRYDGIVSYLDGSFDPITGLGGVVQPAHWIGAPEENALDGYVTGHFPLFGRQHELVAGFTVSRTENRDAPSYGWFLGPWTGYDGTIGSIQGWTGSANVPVFDLASRGDTKVEQDAALSRPGCTSPTPRRWSPAPASPTGNRRPSPGRSTAWRAARSSKKKAS